MVNLPSEQHVAREFLSVREACTRVQVSKRTMYYWLKAGKVEAVRTASGRVRIFADSLWHGRAHSFGP